MRFIIEIAFADDGRATGWIEREGEDGVRTAYSGLLELLRLLEGRGLPGGAGR